MWLNIGQTYLFRMFCENVLWKLIDSLESIILKKLFSIFFFRISVYLCMLLFEVSPLPIETSCAMKMWWFIRNCFISRNKSLFKNTKRGFLNHFKIVFLNQINITPFVSRYFTTFVSQIFFRHSCFSRYYLHRFQTNLIYCILKF